VALSDVRIFNDTERAWPLRDSWVIYLNISLHATSIYCGRVQPSLPSASNY